jgi:4-amino-4-deoxy-L-arabinose transferase-like glycosyltransferase
VATESRWTLPGLALAGLALRLYGAAHAGLTFDESIVWSFAREIHARPVLHLVSRTADHPLLDAYLVRASSLAFGETDLGLRVLHACLGAATIVVVYRIGSALWGARAGLLAAALLAVDPFHVSWSRLGIEEAPLLLFEALALLLIFRGIRQGRARDLAGAGLCVGLAYLAKETALLLLPALALGMVLSERGRDALRRPGPWLGLLAALTIFGLETAWSRTHGDAAHADRAVAILRAPPGLTLKGTSLYVGELYRAVLGPDVLDPDYVDGNAFTTHPVTGLLYLVAAVVAWRRRDDGSRILAAVFSVVFLAASLVDGAKMFDPFWWASLSFLPAVLLAGRLLAEAWPRSPAVRGAVAAVLVALALQDLSWLGRRGSQAPRLSRQEWAARIAADGEQRLAGGDAAAAREQARQALILDAGNVAARALLARVP